MHVGRILGVVALSVVVSGVAIAMLLGFGPDLRDRSMRPAADGCPRLGYDERRCQAIIEQAFTLTALDRSVIDSVQVGLPGGPHKEIGGAVRDQEVWCIGVGNGRRAWCGATSGSIRP